MEPATEEKKEVKIEKWVPAIKDGHVSGKYGRYNCAVYLADTVVQSTRNTIFSGVIDVVEEVMTVSGHK